MSDIRKGDIVKYEDSPCEVIETFTKPLIILIINKRTLCASWLTPDEVEFVRRPEPQRRKQDARRT